MKKRRRNQNLESMGHGGVSKFSFSMYIRPPHELGTRWSDNYLHMITRSRKKKKEKKKGNKSVSTVWLHNRSRNDVE